MSYSSEWVYPSCQTRKICLCPRVFIDSAIRKIRIITTASNTVLKPLCGLTMSITPGCIGIGSHISYRYLDCGGFALVKCKDCGHEYLMAFSFSVPLVIKSTWWNSGNDYIWTFSRRLPMEIFRLSCFLWQPYLIQRQYFHGAPDSLYDPCILLSRTHDLPRSVKRCRIHGKGRGIPCFLISKQLYRSYRPEASG